MTTTRARLAALGVACLIGVVTCALAPATSPTTVRVLFIGNSLTASNDLPTIVQAMARGAGVDLQYETCAPGGANLEDHWDDGHCRALLERGTWDFVVLQQGPSSRDESREDLKRWSARWADAIRARGARPALYMVWPQRGQADGFARVSGSYRIAAEHSHALLLPAGDAWRAALEANRDLSLYSDDGLHPTVQGSYLAALVIAHHLAGVQASAVADRLELKSGRVIELARDDGRTARTAASTVTRARRSNKNPVGVGETYGVRRERNPRRPCHVRRTRRDVGFR